MTQSGIDLPLLIEVISSHPHLYNVKDKDYKNNGLKENTWEEISIVMDTAVEDCKRIWKNLRDRFSKERRTILNSGDPKAKSDWAFYSKMQFYEKYCMPRKRITPRLSSIKNENGIATSILERSLRGTQSQLSPGSTDMDNLENTLESENNTIEIVEIPSKKSKPNETTTIEINDHYNIPKASSSNRITTQRSDVNDSFGSYVANRLKEMTPEEAKECRRSISLIIDG